MSSLVERLRVRSDRKPIYQLDESDDDADFEQGKPGTTVEKFERIVRIDAVSPLNDIDKILDCEMRPTVAGDSDVSKLGSKQIFVKQYLVKWKGLSYLHCTWVPEKEFLKAFKSNPRLRTKVNNFHRQMSSNNNAEEDFVAIRPEWTTVDRILACRGEDDEKEYLVKYKELSYDECYWEYESDISAFQPEIERFIKIQSRSHRSSCNKQKSSPQDVTESTKKPKEFQQYEHSPEFLSGGKTIQSIAFLASLFGERISPHLVVAPLSTLRNWEREFATWAPQMNVVMYVGTSQARNIIREYEFYFPKNPKKVKKKKSGQVVSESKQDRIKFDVLLTSYEMINLDSASLKPIKWQCMIVDEGHRLKNKDSKLFSSLKQYSTRHRVLLTGTPLQNNLDELFMLMHFLDAGKFGSLEEFQEEFKDINQEEQISRLHRMLAPHLLRRVKKDVMKELPPKKELILRVELSSKQKEYYKAILTRNYQILTRRGGAQISLINVVMELRKLCCHPYMLEGVEPDIEDTNESFKQLLESSGKLQLLDKMMVKLKEQGHRVLIYSQFQHMLDLLEDYLTFKKWQYERIDGKVGGAERQIRIDRFNAKNSSRFCFLLSTRAGGLGINLATADTVIIYDSDWNPHADLQAMARAHRLGQTNKVMIFRLITRGSIEERMMQMTKKKMVLEHLVVGRLKAQNINQVTIFFQTWRLLSCSVEGILELVFLWTRSWKNDVWEELDDIIRYGSKELFADENDEGGKSRQIHYDDAAIDRLLDRDQVGDEEASLDDEDEDGFLKAFKVANFEYIEEVEAAAEEEAQKLAAENKSSMSNSERSSYWEELLKDRYEVHKVEEFNALGKGKRSRKQMVSVEEDDLAGLEDVSSEGEDDNYEADLTDGDTTSSGTQPGRKPNKKRSRVDSMEPPPLMEGEGRSFRVLDGVPKEGLRIQDVLVRIAVLLLIRDKAKSHYFTLYSRVKFLSQKPGTPLFTDDIYLRYPGLRGGKFWKEEHDSLLLRAVLKWQAIVDDKDLKVQEVICQELNLPFINLPVPGASSQAPNGANSANPEALQMQGNSTGNDSAAAGVQGTTDAANQAQVYQDSSVLYHFRDMQRRQVEFIKKRVLLLEKGLNAEYQKEYFGDDVKSNEIPSEEPESERKTTERPSPTSMEIDSQMVDQLPKLEAISKDISVALSNVDLVYPLYKFPAEYCSFTAASEEISAAACDSDADRLGLAQHYNEMCKVLEENVHEVVKTSLTSQPASAQLRTNLQLLETLCEDVNQILSTQTSPPLEQPMPNEDKELQPEIQSTSAEPSLPQTERGVNKLDAVVETEVKGTPESEPTVEGSKASSKNPAVADVDSSPADPTSLLGKTGTGMEMAEAKNDADIKTDDKPTGKENSQRDKTGVIVLDD
ncbi:CHD3-type chromatin-remodeling factor PICKLE [Citrus sinensis]|nr:CHD3-type chromatin-remodeling factor PICKLE [Citrus sinensis]